jgi:iron complex outermembrane receptor protein
MHNVAVYAHAMWDATELLHFSAGSRLDWHSMYEHTVSNRAGIVLVLEAIQGTVKLVYGSSYKAPSAEQLYTKPAKVLDLRGNELVRPQTAHTLEANVVSRLLDRSLELHGDVFANYLVNRIEFVQRGNYFEATNATDEWWIGGELRARWEPVKDLRFTSAASFAVPSASTSHERVERHPLVSAPQFPPVQAQLGAEWSHEWIFGALGAEFAWAAPRSATQSNSLLLGAAYSLPDQFELSVYYSLAPITLYDGYNLSATLRFSQLLGKTWSEPGYGGYDIPQPGTRAQLSVAIN